MLPLVADQFGDFTYTDSGSTITITDYPTTAVGAVDIPASIVGKPVTEIGGEAVTWSRTVFQPSRVPPSQAAGTKRGDSAVASRIEELVALARRSGREVIIGIY